MWPRLKITGNGCSFFGVVMTELPILSGHGCRGVRDKGPGACTYFLPVRRQQLSYLRVRAHTAKKCSH